MPVARIGTYTLHQAAADGSIAISVPSDAEMCVVIATGYSSVAGAYPLFDKLSWANTNTVDFPLVVDSTGWGNTQVEVRAMLVTDATWPGSGTKTLYYSSYGSYGEGYNIAVLFYKGIDVGNPVIGTAKRVNGVSWTGTVVGVGANDMIIGAAYRWNGVPNMDAAGYGQTSILESSYAYAGIGIGEKLGSTTCYIESADDQLVPTVFALRASATGTAVTITHDMRAAISSGVAQAHDTTASISTAVVNTADALAMVYAAVSTAVDAAATVATDCTTQSDSSAIVQSQVSAAHDTGAAVSTATGITHDLAAGVSSAIAVSHDTTARVATALTQLHDTLADVATYVGYVVNHDTRAIVDTQLTSSHDLRVTVASAVSMSADVLAVVAVAVDRRHATATTVATQVAQTADTLAAISRQIVIAHDLRAMVVLVNDAINIVFRLAAKTKVFAVSYPQRIFKA